jgi:hypothetical protein
MDSIEQLCTLIFLRLLSERDELMATMDKKYTRIFSGNGLAMPGEFLPSLGDNLSMRPWLIENFHDLPGLSDTGKLLFNRATLKIYDAQLCAQSFRASMK